MSNQSNSQNQNHNSTLGQVFKHSGNIAILLTILGMLAGIGAMVLMGDAPATYENIIEVRPDGFRLENRIKKEGAITE